MFSATALTELGQSIIALRKMTTGLRSAVASLASSNCSDDTPALRRLAGDAQRILIDIQRLDIDVEDLTLAMCVDTPACGRAARSQLQASTSDTSPTVAAAAR